MTVGELLCDAVQRYGDRTAFIAPAGQLTYGALWDQASRLAFALIDAGVRPGDRVSICFSKSPELPVAIFGSLLAGAAYVPIDYTAPASRARQIIADAQPAALVCDGRTARRFFAGEEIDDEQRLLAFRVTDPASPEIIASEIPLPPSLHDPGARLPMRRLPSQSLAYILYTSGSTGRPKGVCQSHASALAFVNWAVAHLGLGADDILSQHASPTFDLSVFDFFAATAAGAALVAVPEWLYGSVGRLCKFIVDTNISIWYSVPSALLRPSAETALPVLGESALRRVVFAGEVLPKATLRTLAATLPAGCRIENWYGPTETNVCTYFEIDARSLADDGPIPIGAPCPYASIDRLKDGSGEAELLVSGATVMEGYWQRPDANASVLTVTADGTRWYRTGDWVTGASDRLVYLGRRDRMLKIRGYRVQPEEVESCLLAHPAVREVAVFVDDATGMDALIAAIVADRSPTLVYELQRFCAEKLPAYMVPRELVCLDALARTERGKIDIPTLRQQIAGMQVVRPTD